MPSNMRKVLVPTDFSEASEAALRHAVECPCAVTREIVLLHVIDPLDIKNLGLVGMVNQEEEMQRELTEDARKKLQELKMRYQREGIEIRSLIVVDRPWRAIIDAAIGEDADHIVMGSHGRGQVAELLLGSVTERVIRHAPVPVTVVRPRGMRARLVKNWRALAE